MSPLVKMTPDKDIKRLTNDFVNDEIQEAIKTLKKNNAKAPTVITFLKPPEYGA